METYLTVQSSRVHAYVAEYTAPSMNGKCGHTTLINMN